MRHFALIAFLGACSFTPGVDALSNDGGLPAGDAHARADGPVLHDAPARVDAPPDAALITLTLSETTSDVATPGDGIYCHGNGAQPTLDNGWFRAFVLSSFDVTGTFHITRIHFTAQESLGGQALITIYEYGSAVTSGTTTLSTAALTAVTSVGVTAARRQHAPRSLRHLLERRHQYLRGRDHELGHGEWARDPHRVPPPRREHRGSVMAELLREHGVR